jgi:hypothetical protein
MVDITTLSSAPYMRCINRYCRSREKHVMNAICHSMIAGCITKEGEYNKAYARKKEKSALDLFVSGDNGKDDNTNGPTKAYVGSAFAVNSTMMANMFKRSPKKPQQYKQTSNNAI